MCDTASLIKNQFVIVSYSKCLLLLLLNEKTGLSVSMNQPFVANCQSRQTPPYMIVYSLVLTWKKFSSLIFTLALVLNFPLS